MSAAKTYLAADLVRNEGETAAAALFKITSKMHLAYYLMTRLVMTIAASRYCSKYSSTLATKIVPILPFRF